MAKLFEVIIHRLAVIMPFTTEEAWTYRPQGIFGTSESIHLNNFIATKDVDESLNGRWNAVKEIRSAVLATIEPKRADKTIGSSLEAHPHIYLNDELANTVAGIDLAEICITSQATIHTETTDTIRVDVQLSEGQKCVRCWKILPEVGSDPEYPDLTLRDADAVRYYKQIQKAA